MVVSKVELIEKISRRARVEEYDWLEWTAQSGRRWSSCLSIRGRLLLGAHGRSQVKSLVSHGILPEV